jgi:16S rRNA C967 or C1407 C5-methylase (RsmB/RsmF family)
VGLDLPQEFENYMRARLGDRFADFCNALESTPPVTLRINPAKIKDHPGERVPWSQFGRYLQERPVFTLDPQLHAGAYYVQEASSMFVEQAVKQSTDLSQPLNVLDLCAAPGGKSTHLLSLLTKESLLVSNEVIRSRATILAENIQKWGNANVIVTNNDPENFGRLPEFFDAIILDAPCSGEGLFRKDPAALSQWSSKNVDLCALRQRRILHDVWPALKPGGIVVYSTCTYNEHENINAMQWLKKEFEPDFIQLKVPDAWGIETISAAGVTGYQFYPHKVKGEGFFLSVLKKKGEASGRRFKIKESLKHPTKTQREEFRPWILSPDTKLFFLHNETVRMLPAAKQSEFQLILNNLNVVIAGTAVLEIMRNKFIPDHALSLSQEINKENFTKISLNHEDAIRYLRKDPVTLSGPVGFALIEFEGLGLGWVNVLQNRYNNLYPASWRIRMS